jgi:D-alanyl-D-alanine carboxypeptidase (penicillin-binding protein 5/6)
MDVNTGVVLYEKNADREIPPASLTKLITIHLALKDVAAGRVSLDDLVNLPRETWAVNQSPGSSLMFLGPGQRVTLRELILGMAVASGNDAAVATALHLAPTVRDFVLRMNAEARSMGLVKTHFADPAGISARNSTTAREYAFFCQRYLKLHPEALAQYHSVREFSYPKPENLPEIYRNRPGTITQRNRNLLLDTIEGVDGLKTGFINESGYNIALTAQRNGTRFLAVLLGGPGSGSAQGGRFRAQDGENLLTWGFENFKTLRPELPSLEPVRIYKGDKRELNVASAESLIKTVRSDRGTNLRYRIEYPATLIAPISKGNAVGELIISDDKGELERLTLQANETVQRGNIFIQIIDSLRLLYQSLFQRKES